jgi:hypothetical protein
VLSGEPDLIAAVSGWWWPAWSVAALVIAGALVSWLSTRVVATVVTVLAGAGLLVYFYISLAVLAKVFSGTAPVQIGTTAWTSVQAAGTTIIFLALGAVGFELPTTAGNRMRSVAAPLGRALGVAGTLAALVLLATNLGATGGFRFDATDLSLIVLEMFGDSGVRWLITGGAALSAAALLALTWAVLRVARRLTGLGTATTVATLAVLAFLTVALCRNWAGAADTLVYVAAMLLVMLYVLVAEANSRLPGAEAAARTGRGPVMPSSPPRRCGRWRSRRWWSAPRPRSAPPLHGERSNHTQAARMLSQPADHPAGHPGDDHRADHRLTGGARVGDVRQPERRPLQRPATDRPEGRSRRGHPSPVFCRSHDYRSNYGVLKDRPAEGPRCVGEPVSRSHPELGRGSRRKRGPCSRCPSPKTNVFGTVAVISAVCALARFGDQDQFAGRGRRSGSAPRCWAIRPPATAAG